MSRTTPTCRSRTHFPHTRSQRALTGGAWIAWPPGAVGPWQGHPAIFLPSAAFRVIRIDLRHQRHGGIRLARVRGARRAEQARRKTKQDNQRQRRCCAATDAECSADAGERHGSEEAIAQDLPGRSADAAARCFPRFLSCELADTSTTFGAISDRIWSDLGQSGIVSDKFGWAKQHSGCVQPTSDGLCRVDRTTVAGAMARSLRPQPRAHHSLTA